MRRSELEHLLSEAGSLARESDFILFGSQAILGLLRNVPRPLLVSNEADLYPRNNPEAVPLIVRRLGPRTRFSDRHGYYLDCVSPDLATLPEGWTERLVPFRTRKTSGVTAWCLEIHDLAASKLAAGRDKDLKYIAVLLRHKLVNPGILENRIEDAPTTPTGRSAMRTRLRRLLVKPAERTTPRRRSTRPRAPRHV